MDIHIIETTLKQVMNDKISFKYLAYTEIIIIKFFVIDILWISKFNLLLLFGYVLLTIIVIIYAKKIYRTLDKNEV